MMSACIHQIFFKDIETFSCAEENFTRTMRSLGNDISYDVPRRVSYLTKFSRHIQRSLLSHGRFQQRGWLRDNVSRNWCPMTRRKGKDLLNALTFWT